MAQPFDVSKTLDGFDPQFTKVWRDFGELVYRHNICFLGFSATAGLKIPKLVSDYNEVLIGKFFEN